MIESGRAEDIPEPRFLGGCAGVRLETYPDGRIEFQLLVEDDEIWHPKEFQMHAYWIPDLIAQLEKARDYYNQHKKEKCNP